MKERRSEERFIVEPDAWVSWRDKGGKRLHLRGRCLDMAGRGMRLEIGRSLPLGSKVTVGVPVKRFQRSGVVRHSTKAGPYFAVGVEFEE